MLCGTRAHIRNSSDLGLRCLKFEEVGGLREAGSASKFEEPPGFAEAVNESRWDLRWLLSSLAVAVASTLIGRAGFVLSKRRGER